ncbi:hypothetical protein [Sphingomonas sp. C3-2]|uniref:hypothetical protein n=1 Tax=Sphingomonas sp. C3-2 TaxID=3062169 RepID=UPI00294AA303|nr:hypothetical protein [Sphingomonas sp. C3-2]WOK36597.1 hypothetical protein QYC26_16630 [Sphingomonas sp. C3-2]
MKRGRTIIFFLALLLGLEAASIAGIAPPPCAAGDPFSLTLMSTEIPRTAPSDDRTYAALIACAALVVGLSRRRAPVKVVLS